MSTVATARGDVELSRLGRTLVHEHVFVFFDTDYVQNYRPDFVESEQIDDAVRQLTELKAAGIDTIMDPTVIGLGRNIPRLKRVADQVGINIVAATGAYTKDAASPALDLTGPGLLVDVPDPMPDLFVQDLTEGIGDTGVKAAFLKCAIDQAGLTPGVERVMRAVAEASLRTGASVTVHTDVTSQSGLVAQKVFQDVGVDLSRLIIGHSGDTTDLDYLMKLADAGSTLGMDRFGVDMMLPFEDRVATVLKLVERGYTDRITLSHDTFCFADAFPPGEPRATIMPDCNYLHISQKVLPALRKAGVTEKQLDAMLVDNPRRILEWGSTSRAPGAGRKGRDDA